MGGIRWLKLNGGNKAVNNEEMRIRQGETLGKRGLLLFGSSIFFYIKEGEGEGRTVLGTVYASVFLDLLAACLRSLPEDFHREHLLLGILGSGTKKP
jgi:hypothetical protein